jgi:catabolite regulation protein CreA
MYEFLHFNFFFFFLKKSLKNSYILNNFNNFKVFKKKNSVIFKSLKIKFLYIQKNIVYWYEINN